jgi:pyruvate dehydrogenase E1 component beta subunit
MGMRPIADVQYADFLFCAMDQVANQVAKMRYMSGGKLEVPMVMRAPVGVTGRGAQHAQMMEPYFLPLPGIKIVCPATAYDAKGLLKAAVRDGNPVLMFEHKLLYGSKGPRSETGSVDASSDIPDGDYTVPIGKGIVRREGKDVTIIATLLMMHRAVEAAGILAEEGISAEVIDPRSLVPFDWDLVKGSVAKTGRVVTVEESPKRGGLGAEIAATLAEEMIDFLVAPVKRVAAPCTPAPFSPPMEKFYVPDAKRIAQAARDLIAIS